MLTRKQIGGWVWIALLILGTQPAVTAEVKWSPSLKEAWNTAQEKNQPLLLLVTKHGCTYCDRIKHETLSDSRVSTEINEKFVPVEVDASQSQRLIDSYQIRAYPTTLIISPKSAVLARIKGYLRAEDFQQRLEESRRDEVAQAPGDGTTSK